MHSHNSGTKVFKRNVSVMAIAIAIGAFILFSNSRLNIKTESDTTNLEQEKYYTAIALEVEETSENDPERGNIINLKTQVEFTSGALKGRKTTIDYQFPAGTNEEKPISKGTTVIVTEYKNFEGKEQYVITDIYRLNSVVLVFVCFFALIVLFTGWQGIYSLFGLGFSILVIIAYVGPQIIAGRDPLAISIIGAVLIATVSIYLAHGVSKRITIALTSTLITIFITAITAFLAVSLVKIFGIASEEALFLTSYLGPVNLKGILLGAIILGALGVLDDVTTAQSAAVEELHHSSPELGLKKLYYKGMSVGKEHILSLVNTLVLAYVSTSFPILLLLVLNDTQPLWVMLNSEFIIEEIMRSIIGSMSLVFAVPITTYLAAFYFTGEFNKLKEKINSYFIKSKSKQPSSN